MTDTTLRVDNSAHPRGGYDVVVGHDLGARLPEILGPGTARVAIIHPETLDEPVRRVTEALASYDVLDLPIPDGEAAKSAATAARCWDRLGEVGFTRTDAVVTVGGGATTDLGGFVAATWLRGVPVVHVPTTVLGMVDAAVGGKTGINTAAGKNLVGAFHEPSGVLCDLAMLRTLDRAELASGMAEVVKCGFIADPAILEVVDRSPETAMTPGTPELRELVERAIRVKIDVVSADLRETGGTDGHPGREALNYGHTLGHAIERAEHYRVRHGEAVAVGMVFVAELARAVGLLDDATVARHREVLSSVGLPTTYDGADWPDLLATMRVDKKTRGDVLRFVVLDALAHPVVLEGPSDADLLHAWESVSGRRSRFPFVRD